jgi:DNA anti-recombination protein RmuC
VLDATDSAVAGLTDASVRLLELIQAGSQHSREHLPAALAAAEQRLGDFEARSRELGAMLGDAADKGAALAEHVTTAQTVGKATIEELEALHTGLAGHDAAQAERIEGLRASLAALGEESEKLSQRAGGELAEAVGKLQGALSEAVDQFGNSEAIDGLAERIGEHSSEAIERVIRLRATEAIGELEQAAAHASGVGREAARQLRDQLAKVDELAGNLESRVARARSQAEEQVDNDFARRVALITESLNSNSIDIAKALSNDVTDTAWASYLRGDRGIFTRRAVRLLDNSEAREIAEIYDRDHDFREHVSRYIHDFEAMLRTMLSTRDGHALGVTLLSSDMGKLYVALAQAIERLRD